MFVSVYMADILAGRVSCICVTVLGTDHDHLLYAPMASTLARLSRWRTFATLTRNFQPIQRTPEGAVIVSYEDLKARPQALRPSIGSRPDLIVNSEFDELTHCRGCIWLKARSIGNTCRFGPSCGLCRKTREIAEAC